MPPGRPLVFENLDLMVTLNKRYQLMLLSSAAYSTFSFPFERLLVPKYFTPWLSMHQKICVKLTVHLSIFEIIK